MVKKNSVKAWFLAARPKTLTGAAAPVLMGGAMAWRDGGGEGFFFPFVACLLFAFLMQIDANFVNDWWDFKKGTDREDRLGPERACAQGWISEKAMAIGIGVCTVFACGVGLFLLFWRMQWELLLVGIACVLGCFLYTLKLSYLGWGDVLVLLFFGLVPVCFTYYVIMGIVCPPSVILASLGMGLITDNLLIVNNYRDVEQDRLSGKKTIVVRFGKKFAERMYLANGIIAGLLMFAVNFGSLSIYFFMIVLLGTYYLYKEMCHLTGKSLNKILGKTALLIFAYGLLCAELAIFS